MPQVKQTIGISDRHWGDIFRLPCVLEISKMHCEDTRPRPYAVIDCGQCIHYIGQCTHPCPDDDCYEAYPGDKLIEYDNGKWEIRKPSTNK